MTALKDFQRLEATGLWRPDPDAQRREVIVSLGDATLTMSDTNGTALAHWSLGAVNRVNGTQLPALYHPDNDPGETLELSSDEVEMIAGLDRLIKAIDRRRPRPGKLRFLLTGLITAALVAGAVFWLPDALVRYATTVVPPVKRFEIGAQLLTEITRLTGQPCMTRDARGPLDRFAQRLHPGGQVVILPAGAFTSAHVPGNIILLNRAVIEDYEDPDVAAGFVVVEALRAAQSDPLASLLDAAGLTATLRLLTTGNMPGNALAAYAETVMTRGGGSPAVTDLIAAFDAAALRSTPYAYAVDLTGETTLPLIEADPRRAIGSKAVLNDADWVRLQGICGA